MPSTDPVEAILRKLVPFLQLEGDEVHIYAYDAGESVVVATSPAEREYLVELGMRFDAAD